MERSAQLNRVCTQLRRELKPVFDGQVGIRISLFTRREFLQCRRKHTNRHELRLETSCPHLYSSPPNGAAQGQSRRPIAQPFLAGILRAADRALTPRSSGSSTGQSKRREPLSYYYDRGPPTCSPIAFAVDLLTGLTVVAHAVSLSGLALCLNPTGLRRHNSVMKKHAPSHLEGEKILITGATGAIALPVACALAEKNEVWGAARFSDPNLRGELEAAGVRTVAVDFEKNDFEALPTDFTLLIHYAYTRRPSGEFQEAIGVNSLSAGHMMQRCSNARAALIVSAATLYSAHEDPYYAYRESDDIGYVRAPWGPSSPVSKVTLEAVARFAAQAFNLPTTIVRPSGPYGTRADIASVVVDAVFEGNPVYALNDPQPYSVIHIDDMIDQIPALFDAASVPATLLNWASDEIVTTQEMAAQAASHFGKPVNVEVMQVEGVGIGAVLDTSRLRPLVPPASRTFEEEFERICKSRARGGPVDPG